MHHFLYFKKNTLTLIFFFIALLSITHTQAAELYQVSGVESNDVLNMRSAAGVKNKLLGKIPANGKSIKVIGKPVVVGKTQWVKVQWKKQQGWVSKAYLKAMPKTVAQPAKAANTAQNKQAQANKTASKPIQTKQVVKQTAQSSKQESNYKWVLRCGDTSPFWRVDVHPKTMEIHKGNYKTELPITYKKQKKNKWNTATKTHLKGAAAADKVDLDIRFSYSKCPDRLTKLKLPYRATMTFNDEELTGCCRAIKIK